MTKIKKLKSGSWHSLVYAGTNAEGKREYKSITAPTKAECEYLVAEFKKGLKTKPKSDLTVRQAIEKYIAKRANDIEPLSPVTVDTYQKILKYSFQELMEMPCKKLTQEILEKAVEKEKGRNGERTGKKLAPKTITNRFSLVKTALAFNGYTFKPITTPKTKKKNRIYPEPKEVLNAIIGSNIEIPCLLAMWMSLREGEIIGLTLGSIHGNILTIDQTVSTIQRRQIVKDFAKTDESIRMLKIPPYILQLIHNTETWKNRENLPKNTPIFDYTGNALHHRFMRLMAKNNLDIHFHDLRKYFAGVSLNVLKIPEKQIQHDGGWKTDEIMKEVYGITFASTKDEAFELRNNYYSSIINK